MRTPSQTGNGQDVRSLEGQEFTSADVIELTGITARQLQWWDERKIVVPQRRGRNRVYSVDDLAEVAVICELRNKGFSLQRVRQVMRYLQQSSIGLVAGDRSLDLAVELVLRSGE